MDLDPATALTDARLVAELQRGLSERKQLLDAQLAEIAQLKARREGGKMPHSFSPLTPKLYFSVFMGPAEAKREQRLKQNRQRYTCPSENKVYAPVTKANVSCTQGDC
jgi:hypothetical protein